MSTERSTNVTPSHPLTFSLTEILLLALALSAGLAIIVLSNLDYALNTALLLFAVTILGFILAKRTARALGDPALNVIGLFWLLKILITLILLRLGWMPDLEDYFSANWGYDPQRFYKYSEDLILNDWVPNFGLNYMGIIYYYAAIFSAIGRNPMIPALINSLVTLLGILFLIRSLYVFFPIRTKKDWTIAYLLLIPEVLWYDVMTSREMLMATLILSCLLIIGKNIVAIKGVGHKSSWLLVFFLLFAIILVRTSMIMPILLGAMVMFFVLSQEVRPSSLKKFSTFIVLGLAGFIGLFVATIIQGLAGSSNFNFVSQVGTALSAADNIASDIDGWSDRSIGLLLMPNGLIQAILFLPPRMILYLAAPLPNITVTLSGLLTGYFSAWQSLMTIPTSFLMIILSPYVLAGTSLAWGLRRRAPSGLIIPISFWVTIIAVAGGNLIIHERYRLMFTLLFFASAWIGYTRCNSRAVRRWAVPWFMMLCFLFFFYYIYKLT